jgi:flagellar hook-basal body complex protein FliE
MLPVSAASSLAARALQFQPEVERVRSPGLEKAGGTPAAGGDFGSVFERMVNDVETRQADASEVTRSVLLGHPDPLTRMVCPRPLSRNMARVAALRPGNSNVSKMSRAVRPRSDRGTAPPCVLIC